jgi:hypothetical protein
LAHVRFFEAGVAPAHRHYKESYDVGAANGREENPPAKSLSNGALQIADVDSFACAGRCDPRDAGRKAQGLICLSFSARLTLGEIINAKPMEERRKHPRTEIDQPAYVSAGGSVMSCRVRNISAEGAAIDVENPAFVPPQFRLVIAQDSSVYECRIAWIQRNRIGVSFTALPQGPHQRNDKG